MRSFDFLTPARIRVISLVLVAAAVVAMLLWIAPVLSGQVDPVQAVPACLWLVVFGILLLILNYVETRRQALLRRVWVDSCSFFDGSAVLPYAGVSDLMEQLVVSFVNSDERTGVPQTPSDREYLLTVETMTFEYDRDSGLLSEDGSAARILRPLKVREPLEEGSGVSVVRWAGVVRVLEGEGRGRVMPFSTVDELESVLAEELENGDSQDLRPGLA